MDIKLLEVKNRRERKGTISIGTFENRASISSEWNFNWKELFKTEGANFYKISLYDFPKQIEGLLMLSIYFDEMVYMNNLELAPYNIGKSKKFDWVAGCLIAFACRFSLEHGKGPYQGYLTFESKTSLIPLYKEKYGAMRAGRQKLYIDPSQGEKLIDRFLNA